MLDIDLSEVPTKREANIGQWLASRNLGLVPVASPETFEWPGRFLGLRSDTSTWAVFSVEQGGGPRTYSGRGARGAYAPACPLRKEKGGFDPVRAAQGSSP
jgi:hypothetical protein